MGAGGELRRRGRGICEGDGGIGCGDPCWLRERRGEGTMGVRMMCTELSKGEGDCATAQA
jgi:hypothetical protein